MSRRYNVSGGKKIILCAAQLVAPTYHPTCSVCPNFKWIQLQSRRPLANKQTKDIEDGIENSRNNTRI